MIFTAPLFIKLAKKADGKKYHINLNNYRNWNFIVSNNLKKHYKALLESQLAGFSVDKYIRINFTMHRGDKRRVDRANVLSIHEKFFCDALVEYGCLPDDNDEYIESSHYYTGAIDKESPRVEVAIEFVDKIAHRGLLGGVDNLSIVKSNNEVIVALLSR